MGFTTTSAVFVRFYVCFYDEMSRKIRLDLHLLTKGIVDSRNRAQQIIRAGKVRDSLGQVLDKPGHEVPLGLEVIVQESPRFVSRGGQKLLAAIDSFPIDVSGMVCLDCGISTGGFTDCLFQHGAKKVYGIDVGYGQTAWSLRTDPRLVLLERTNLRKLTIEDLYQPQDQWATFAVADLSFISLKLVLPTIKSLLMDDNPQVVLLVKPQFEVGKEKVGKGGVVRNPQFHIDALKSIIKFSLEESWKPKGLIPSPITGPSGNHEYLLWLAKEGDSEFLSVEKIVQNTLS